MVDIWAGYIGIFEDKGTWLAANNPNILDLDDYTAHGNDYILLNVLSFEKAEDPDLGKINIANRNTSFFGVQVVNATWNLTGWIRDDSTQLALEKMNEIEEFIDRHSKIADPALYLIFRKALSAVWKYKLFIDNLGNRDRKYGKGKPGPVKTKGQAPKNRLDYVLQYNEGWL